MSLLKKGGTTKGIALPPAPAAPVAGGPRPATGLGTGSIRRATANLQTLPSGTVLQGRYAVETLLGVGGMSLVYRGRDLRFKDVVRACAIKEMVQSAPDSGTRMLTLKNFEREAGLLATLSHAAIPKVYDFFEENEKIYLVMELIAGRDLEAVLDAARAPLDEQRVGRWALQICDVLHYLHTHTPEPIIFRDMKPSNIMITDDERVVLIDFGIARIFQHNQRKGTMIGTEGYAPPEQYRGIADPRGDIYALGATLHHLLTNTDPRLETPFTFHERPIRQINPQVSPELEAVIMQALEYEPERRPQSALEFKALLARVPGLAAAAVSLPTTVTVVSGTTRGTPGTEQVWRFACEEEVRSSPHVRNGLLYIGSYDTNLYALDAGSGEFRWKRATLGGISSSPTTWGELVIVGSEDGQVYAFEARKGVQKWAFRTGRAVRSSPRIEDRIIYVGSDDQHVYAIDGLNGRLLWKYRTWMPVRSSAAIANGLVAIGSSDGHLYGLDAFNGSLRWKHRTQQGIISSPAIGDGLVFFGSMDGNVYALDAEGGWPVWRFRTGHYVNSSPALVGTRLFIGGVDGNLYALEAKTGKLQWKFESGAQITSSPRVAEGRVYVGGVDGKVYALDAASGALIWTFQTDGPVVSSPAIANGLVYVGSLDHHVYALRA
ncbi:PQQ-binding-like beta-propeller repeat protein [Kallotenue papyrolyticum]|uniref:beta-alanine-activating enzyme beta-propeller domain-containing protein n=1 Tax=Kallotenue papyrolyticum TaxID=1325125 RepID=UPI0004785CEB|nr:serine/threonine-protein kinase [Kallotenue papyrolyticum]